MNTNQKAIDLLEQNEYEEALKLFQIAVEESRNIQSLNNLAWMYSYEENDDEKALELIEEAISLNPSTYFPFNILGEIYIRQKKWQLASEAFLKSISIQPSNEAYHNLAVAKYHLGDLKEASDIFLQVAGDSDDAMFGHVKCLIDLGMKTEARKKLEAFNEEADEFVGEIAVADLYVELDCYKEAIYWFEKGWKEYWKVPYWVSRFVYSLFKTKNINRIYEVIQESLEQKDEEIKDAFEEECEENWTENDKKENIKQLCEEKDKYQNMLELISSGHIPLIEFDPAATGGCYLFGCKRHNHPEYQE
ncbi:tetratricopeptide repeat protein [Bacillus salipaludis]|uniref:Tetratricopeptide repeat protein n=1 Tax=Bacillus salipaludis TaxID=2547811 RepID=A0A4R5VTJ0_9BACI|nr:tetratricopeptide repeat protein [Bacillus salipaludis]TDK61780.1 tetratricopeptide repeat protein [Bacillus salipaludis]